MKINIYDNGEKLLGNVYDLKYYINKYSNMWDNNEIVRDITHDLEDLDENDLVVINYDNPMGYTIDYWKESDKYER